jgi:hypothetical protein
MRLELAAQSVRMSFLQMALHLLFFFLPALALALFCVGCGTWLFRPGAGVPWPRRWAMNAAAGVLVLVAGLVVFDNDGKMATYAALVAVSATLEWVLQKGWRGR